jgi:predicted transcriptional regulator
MFTKRQGGVMAKIKKEQIKALYLQGKSITDICAILGVSRPTIYKYKKADEKKGISWDELCYQKSADISDMVNKEKEFLSHLISSFEKEIEKLDEIENPTLRLSVLDKYVRSYYRIKAPIKTDCRVQVFEALSLFIREMGSLAGAKENKTVIDFLSQNSDFLIEKVQTLTKGF